MGRVWPIVLLFGQCVWSLPTYVATNTTAEDSDSVEQYEEKFIYQYIDHFNYLGQAGKNGEFKMRYLVSDKYWKGSSGPVLFYCGNEGSIVNFWENTGFVFALARKLNALVVFGEHRYYGKSLPFGSNSFTTENIGFLSIEQTLADYAILLKRVRKDYDIPKHPIFAFGGSYGGILAGYMRYKYPHIIAGAVASSAPFYSIAGKGDRHAFWHSVTETFRKADPTCPDSIREGFTSLLDLFRHGDRGVAMIAKAFNLCPTQFYVPYVEKQIIAWARNAFTLLAMVDYPYPAKFMADLPGHPVNLACSYMTGGNKLVGLGNITQLLYGRTKTCHDTYREYVACSDPTGCGTGPDNPPWDYQACTEMILPGGSTNVTDMFPALAFSIDMRQHYCQGKFKLGFSRLDWLATNYFGSDDDVRKASRIIFPNGDLDPWRSGGVLKDLSPSLIAITVKGGAHHLDLRAANKADPQSVIDARLRITKIIMQWMEEDHRRAQ